MIATVAVAAILLAYPLVNEHTTSPCGALEQWVEHGVGQGVIHPEFWMESPVCVIPGCNGEVAHEVAKTTYPRLPAGLTCTVAYWIDFVFDEKR